MITTHEGVLMQETAALLTNLFPEGIPSVFIPFIVFLINEKQYSDLDVKVITEDFFKEFGIALPPLVISNLLSEVESNGYIYLLQGKYISNPAKIVPYQFSTEYSKALDRYEELKAFYGEFAAKEIGLPQLTDAELENIVLDIIQKVSIDSPDNISEKEEKDPLSAHKMAINDFILDANKNHPEIVDVVNQFAVSNALWNVIAHDEETAQYFNKKVKIFLDTRCVFRLIGLEGDYWKDVFESFVYSIVKNGGEVYIFQHVLDEINGILDAARKVYNSDDFDYERASMVARQFRFRAYSAAEIDSIIYNLNHNSIVYNFAVEAHDYEESTNQYQVDYNLMKRTLVNLYKEHNSNFDLEAKGMSIETDIRSLTMVYRICGKNAPMSISDADVLFVTTNTALAKAAKQYDRRQHRHGIPLCLTANYLSTFIWLGTPTDYIKQNRIKLLAYCYAAVHPTSEQMKKYFQQVKQLKKKKTYSDDHLKFIRENPTLIRLYTLRSSAAPENPPSLDEVFELLLQKKKQEEEDHQKETQELRAALQSFEEKEAEEARKREKMQNDATNYANSKLKILEDGVLPGFISIALLVIACVSYKYIKAAYIKELVTLLSAALSAVFALLIAMVKCSKNTRSCIEKYLIKRYKIKHMDT